MAGGENKGRFTLKLSMSMYLYILMLISVSFFSVKLIGRVMAGNLALICFLLWLCAGHLMFKPEEKRNKLTVSHYDWPVVFFFAGILLSFISAYFFYSQSFLTSLVCTRQMLALLMLPVLIAIKPPVESLRKACWWFSISIFLISLADAAGLGIVERELLISEEKMMKSQYIEEGSFVFLFPGFQFVAVSFFFELQALRQEFCKRNILRSLFLAIVIFVFQNRSMLFPCALVLLFTLFTIDAGSRSRTRFVRIASLLAMLLAFLLSINQWISLFTETTTQLGDDGYNRILALNHFLLEPPANPICYLIGSGFISAKTNTIMQELMASGIYNSDVGLIGLWNYYGLLPVISILVVTLMCLFGKKSSYALRCNAFLILAGSITITCFDGMNTIPWLCTVLYLWSVDYQS